mmetsp:Transcript_8811/g.26729  ORF Transcript_8811/g.26729 Transcript_8811/m.26729 type:complete len:309 (+) Transcript_8811:880-1806(+)
MALPSAPVKLPSAPPPAPASAPTAEALPDNPADADADCVAAACATAGMPATPPPRPPPTTPACADADAALLWILQLLSTQSDPAHAAVPLPLPPSTLRWARLRPSTPPLPTPQMPLPPPPETPLPKPSKLPTYSSSKASAAQHGACAYTVVRANGGGTVSCAPELPSVPPLWQPVPLPAHAGGVGRTESSCRVSISCSRLEPLLGRSSAVHSSMMASSSVGCEPSWRMHARPLKTLSTPMPRRSAAEALASGCDSMPPQRPHAREKARGCCTFSTDMRLFCSRAVLPRARLFLWQREPPHALSGRRSN